jgi:LysM repeat protein
MGIKLLLILLFSMTLQGFALAQVYFPLTTRDGVLYHKVFIREGMTLFSISQESNVSSTQIKADNPTLTDNVQLGATVFVRASRSTFSYLALIGDTPFGIAKKFAITLDSLIAINPSLSKGVQLNQHVLIKNGVKRWIDASVNVPAEEGEGPVVERSFRTFEFMLKKLLTNYLLANYLLANYLLANYLRSNYLLTTHLLITHLLITY